MHIADKAFNLAIPIPLVLQTAYAELLSRGAAASFESAYSEAGSFTSKSVGGRRYWYFQPATRDGRKQRYVGPESEELLDRIRSHRQSRDDIRERRALVSTLVRSAYLPRVGEEMGAVLTALSRAGIFNRGAVLVGTVAYQSYAAMLAERLPISAVTTADIDIASDRTVAVSVEGTESLLDVLRSVDGSFQPVPNIRNARAVSYQTGRLRVDAIVANTGPDSDEPVFSPAIGSDAVPLRFMDFLIRDPVPAILLFEEGIYVLVPAPERYAIHKLIISQRRSSASAKVDKDLRQAESLLTILLGKRSSPLKDIWDEAWSTGPKWKEAMSRGLGRLSSSVRDQMLQGVGLTRSAIDSPALQFRDSVPRYVFDRDMVVFDAWSSDERVICGISREALEDHFKGDGLDRAGRVDLVRQNRTAVEELAALKYAHWPIEDITMTLVRTEDVPHLQSYLKQKRISP